MVRTTSSWHRPGARPARVSRTCISKESSLLVTGGDAALGVVGVGLGAGFLGDNGDAPERRDFQGEGKPGDAAAQDKKVKLFHIGVRCQSIAFCR